MTKVTAINRRANNAPDPEFRSLRDQMASIMRLFPAKSFAGRRRYLSTLRRMLAPGALIEGQPLLPELRPDFERIERDLACAHVRAAAREIAAQYEISFPATEADFFRICESENIGIANRNEGYAAHLGRRPRFTAACLLSRPDIGFHIFINDRLAGAAALKSMFVLLGMYFLHRKPGGGALDPHGAQADAERLEAEEFAAHLINARAESAAASMPAAA